ncbi:MAG: hypothetical protein ABIB47_05035 [Candidatus Woesearchaeota archaeon]
MAKRKASRKRSSSKRGSKATLSKALSVPSGTVCRVCGFNPCCCHSKGLGWILLILGVLYLIRDLGGFAWWTVQWWTILFILFGIWMLKK